MDRFDVIVVGAGHAGCEAALAAARMGFRTVVFTITLDNVALMPCNPSVGGPGKAHLVREIDALGGEMGRSTDYAYMHIRMLNTRKGPAVQALRAQTDRKLYSWRMRQVLEREPNVYLREGCVEEILVRGGAVEGVVLESGERVTARAVIVATGTYMRSLIHMGEVHYEAGPQSQRTTHGLSRSLEKLGFRLARFKTGTPPRANSRSVDYSRMTPLEGEPLVQGFSFRGKLAPKRQVPCWLTYTTRETQAIMQANLHRTALYSGAIVGIGPRYCPSLESKIVQFPDRDSHQVYVEPEGWDTQEVYLSGLSTSLPADVQVELVRTIPGLENVELMRLAYAIEYDCLGPHQLWKTLESRSINGLYFAGQINGSSGYEEAAAQGLIAGINCALKLKGEPPFILGRDEAYIGVLIDDLVTKTISEPYRMMTSLAEYRLLLRQDNADRRLSVYGRNLGLLTDDEYDTIQRKWEAVDKEIEALRSWRITPSERVNGILREMGSVPLQHVVSGEELLRRPEMSYSRLAALGWTSGVDEGLEQIVETEIKYAGYIQKQQREVERFRKLEAKRLPEWLNYGEIEGLSREAREKLTAVRPESVGQASRIAGVSPADISVLLIYLEQKRRGRGGGAGRMKDGGQG
ncbi:MAG TPA: tRNA uridine-5-carboxymethylaminomethyl(34) synthesis enzyme MnmG [Firmicutes bacterium]|nr:tRNA uridine-5-carboxymethylaminomethyl(34) synthesis enzyme MnmG [Bacillota bacterium]